MDHTKTIIGIWGTGKDPQPEPEMRLAVDESPNAIIRCRHLAIVTLNVPTDAPRTVIDTYNWYITVPRVLVDEGYRKMADAIMQHDAVYYGHIYTFREIIPPHHDRLLSLSDITYDDLYSYPMMTIVYSLRNPISALQRTWGRWENVDTTAIDISKMGLYPFAIIGNKRIKTIVLTSGDHGKYQLCSTSAHLLRAMCEIGPSETVLVVSAHNHAPEARVCPQHLRMLIKVGIISSEYAVAHICNLADAANITYD